MARRVQKTVVQEPSAAEAELMLAHEIAACELDPERFVWLAFPWGKKGTPLANKKPRSWFLRLCRRIRAKLLENKAKPEDRWLVIQEAVASGHGIGKSAGMSQLILWAMSTMENTRGVITANTFTQLSTKTWPELIKWHSLMINRHWFTCTATRIYANANPDGWRIDAIPWSEHNTEAFAGLHNEGKRIFLGFDEASAIADAVWETAEGALTDEGTQIIWLAMGNPTRATGRFRECFTRQKEFWGTMNVDSRTVEGVNLDRINRWLRMYGENSQFFNVRVRGSFVEADANQLIPLEWITDARLRGHSVVPDGSVPRLRLSLDVADGGEDDTVLTAARHYQSFRHVLKQTKFNFLPSVSPVEGAEAAARAWGGWECDSSRGDDIVVDSLGVGAGAAGNLLKGGYPVIAYKGGEASSNPQMFRNRRVQSYIALRNEFRDGLIALDPDMLPDDEAWAEFEAQLTSIRSRPGTEKLEDLETREQMARNGVPSPDHADSLAMQYATQEPSLGQHAPLSTLLTQIHVEPLQVMDGYFSG